MEKLRNVLILAAALVLLPVGCTGHDDSKEPWYPHVVQHWTITPGGVLRDAGPFTSVDGGYTSQAELDLAVDAAFHHFEVLFPQLPVAASAVALNDDYVMWVKNPGAWASGLEITGDSTLHVCIWTRFESATPPPPASPDWFIVRPPGNYWGVYYQNWRWTSRPLVPAVEHELLHAAIDDPNHTRPEWLTLNSDPRQRAVQERCAQIVALDRF